MACGPQNQRKRVFIKNFIEISKRRAPLGFVVRGTTSGNSFEIAVSCAVAQRTQCYGDWKAHRKKKHRTKYCYSRCHGASNLKLPKKNSPRFDPLVALIAHFELKFDCFYVSLKRQSRCLAAIQGLARPQLFFANHNAPDRFRCAPEPKGQLS